MKCFDCGAIDSMETERDTDNTGRRLSIQFCTECGEVDAVDW